MHVLFAYGSIAAGFGMVLVRRSDGLLVSAESRSNRKGAGSMKKVVLSVLAALAVSTAAPAFAADMPVKASKIVAPVAVSPFDIAFGVAFTSDYVLRGISQSNRKPAVQGYFEGRYTINDMVQLYAGIWGSSVAGYNA